MFRIRKLHEKQSVALYSMIASVFLIAGKLIVGLITGSLAILAEALHSFLDLSASTITFVAVRISDKPADHEHQFGHGKVESLAASVEVILLVITCGVIIYEATNRLLSGSHPLELNIWAFVVIVAAIAIDVSRVRALGRVAKKYSSQALAADALNFSTDIMSSLVVLFGLAAVKLGVAWADSVAAIGVAVFIITAAVRMGKQAIDVLLDRAPGEIETAIRMIVGEFPDVLGITALRVRSDSRTTFGALNLDVDRSLTFSRANDLKNRIHREFKERLPQADITLTFNPVSKESEMIADSIRFVVSSFGFPLHHLIISQSQDGYFASMHVEMPGQISLHEAHERAEEIKRRLSETVTDLKRVVIHTQPYEVESESDVAAKERAEQFARKVKEVVESFPDVEDCHNIVLTPRKTGLALSCDIRLDGRLSLDRSHLTAKQVEDKLRAQITELVSITLHLEPFRHHTS